MVLMAEDRGVGGLAERGFTEPHLAPALAPAEPEPETSNVPPENFVNSPEIDKVQEDWCRRNDPNLTAQSCIELKDKKPWPKWLGVDR
jgi:hypothetical protein